MVEPTNKHIGIAIAAFNAEAYIADTLKALLPGHFITVLFNDGSSDQTSRVAKEVNPELIVLDGDGDAWWAGGTNQAIAECLRQGCTHVLLLNPDAVISAEGVLQLWEYSVAHSKTITAALVVDKKNTQKIAWAGSLFGPLHRGSPIYCSRYIAHRGDDIQAVGILPYETDEVHGRGVLIPREILEDVGALDDTTFPHYGADVDYSLRLRDVGISLMILPLVRVVLDIDNSGMATPNLKGRIRGIGQYLFVQKHGDAVRVLWKIYSRHLSPLSASCSYTFGLALNCYRRLIPRA